MEENKSEEYVKQAQVGDNQIQSNSINKKTVAQNGWAFVALGCFIMIFCFGLCIGGAYLLFSSFSDSGADSDSNISRVEDSENRSTNGNSERSNSRDTSSGSNNTGSVNWEDLEESDYEVSDLGSTRESEDVAFTLHEIKQKGDSLHISITVKNNGDSDYYFIATRSIRLTDRGGDQDFLRNYDLEKYTEKSIEGIVSPENARSGTVTYDLEGKRPEVLNLIVAKDWSVENDQVSSYRLLLKVRK